ncbi:MAG: hypothetical protein KDC52_00945 [Ignavibacteriae bacterium]|nr:hypothetical protein [Ignavibacteriota bacterium]
MSQIENETTENSNEMSSSYYISFSLVVFIINFIAVLVAWNDKSWTALNIAIITGPIINVILIFISLGFIVEYKNRANFSIERHKTYSITVPILAIFIDAVVIFSLGLSGC